MWTTVADLFAKHRDFALGSVVTLLLMAIYDVLKVGSITGFRKIGNRLSEVSVFRLRNRIRGLELYREAVKSAEAQDRLLLLLQFAVSAFMVMSIGTICLIIGILFTAARAIF